MRQDLFLLSAITLAFLVACADSSKSRQAVAPGSPQTTSAPSAAPPVAPSAATDTTPGAPAGRMARIPEATFRMGSETGEADERPVHEVHVAAFDLDLTEVTVGDYGRCVQSHSCDPAPTKVWWPGVTNADQDRFGDECNDSRADRQDHAVNCVDWAKADAFCRWAGKRLPTEEEWEYAACAGDCNLSLNAGSERAVLHGSTRWPGTARVGGSAGPFGLYDMAGNVWEWTASKYCPYDHPGCGDSRQVIRGGSWSMVDYLFVRLTDRSPSNPSTRNTNVGFRCARSSATRP